MESWKGYLSETTGVAKGMKYTELEYLFDTAVADDDFNKFKAIISDLYNKDMEKDFMRFYAAYDTRYDLSKALFATLKKLQSK